MRNEILFVIYIINFIWVSTSNNNGWIYCTFTWNGVERIIPSLAVPLICFETDCCSIWHANDLRKQEDYDWHYWCHVQSWKKAFFTHCLFSRCTTAHDRIDFECISFLQSNCFCVRQLPTGEGGVIWLAAAVASWWSFYLFDVHKFCDKKT